MLKDIGYITDFTVLQIITKQVRILPAGGQLWNSFIEKKYFL